MVGEAIRLDEGDHTTYVLVKFPADRASPGF